MSGIDPRLTDPEHGDYRPAPGSPAAAYGCQTFGRAAAPVRTVLPPSAPECPEHYRQDIIEVSGEITVDTTWDAAIVHVVGDVSILPGATLTIPPGVRVEFAGYYRLTVLGTLWAVGTPDCRIHFNADRPWDFRADASLVGCWNGIRFDATSDANAPSRLEYCIIEHSKAVGYSSGPYPYGGGALSVVDFSNLTVANSIIRNNVAHYGGAVFLYRQANPRLLGNLITDNHALDNASAIYCAYSYPRIVNNTIVRNTIRNSENPYIESCAVLSFLAKPAFADNVIRENDPEYFYLHGQLWNNKDFYTRFNNIADYPEIGGNIDADPLFTNPLGPDGIPGTGDDEFRPAQDSPCIDAGSNAFVPADLATDLDGLPRIRNGTGVGSAAVDMGAYERLDPSCPGDLDRDRDVDIADLAALLAHYGTASGAGYESGDLDGDGDVDLSDLATLLSLYGLNCD